MSIGVPRIRIKSANSKWVNIMYTSSSAKSRMPMEQLKNQIKSGLIEVVNPDLLPD